MHAGSAGGARGDCIRTARPRTPRGRPREVVSGAGVLQDRGVAGHAIARWRWRADEPGDSHRRPVAVPAGRRHRGAGARGHRTACDRRRGHVGRVDGLCLRRGRHAPGDDGGVARLSAPRRDHRQRGHARDRARPDRELGSQERAPGRHHADERDQERVDRRRSRRHAASSRGRGLRRCLAEQAPARMRRPRRPTQYRPGRSAVRICPDGCPDHRSPRTSPGQGHGDRDERDQRERNRGRDEPPLDAQGDRHQCRDAGAPALDLRGRRARLRGDPAGQCRAQAEGADGGAVRHRRRVHGGHHPDRRALAGRKGRAGGGLHRPAALRVRRRLAQHLDARTRRARRSGSREVQGSRS